MTYRNKHVLLKLNQVSKTYGAFTALHPINLKIASGECHAIVGENGAGKSTLINIITGVIASETGSIEFDNKKTRTLTPKQSNKLGISTVHQELSLCPHLSIVDNIFLGQRANHFLGIRKYRDMVNETRKLLKEVELSHLNPNQKINTLTLGEQQLIEFMKAFHQQPKLLILDEATSALDTNQVRLIFQKIQRNKKEGMSVLFISHRLQEVYTLCERITILKDGEHIITDNTEKYNEDDLIKLMTGREFKDLFQINKYESKTKSVLNVHELNTEKIKNINLTLYEGEILGIGGLQGQGQEEILKALFGITRIVSGYIKMNGRKIKLRHPIDAMNHGFAYLPSDRTSESLLLEHSIAFNSTLTNLQKIMNKFLTINKKHEKLFVEKAMNRMQVSARSVRQTVQSLSGGNQQKIALIKWIERTPNILLLNEPTRGIDVGTKKEIYDLLRHLASNGMSIIIISSEALELIGLCHRIAVMYEFEINGVLKGEEISEENLVRTAILKRGEE